MSSNNIALRALTYIGNAHVDKEKNPGCMPSTVKRLAKRYMMLGGMVCRLRRLRKQMDEQVCTTEVKSRWCPTRSLVGLKIGLRIGRDVWAMQGGPMRLPNPKILGDGGA